MLKVNELFVSIQGEGPGSGRRACFVRFSGCNLNCSWCDTKYALHTFMRVDVHQIVQAIDNANCPYVVLTGGEPMIQDDFGKLLNALNDVDVSVDVETNGTILPTPGQDWPRFVVSPKSFEVAEKWLKIEGIDFVFKFVVDVDNCEEIMGWTKEHNLEGVYFMPKTNYRTNAMHRCKMDEIVAMGNIVITMMHKYEIDGILCTRLQNLYTVR